MAVLLDQINSPQDLKSLSLAELKQLAADIRAQIVQTVSVNGGHLGANLGVVELTLALHTVLDSPRDKIVWDVGHQAYPHKLITGRREQFSTLRQYGGLSGFPRLVESEHDAFGTAHAGTSVSAALGYALARDYLGDDHAVVAVIGDGAFTAGMAFEAMNNAGDLGTGMVVILNDNEMSIAPNVGAFSEYLTRLRTDRTIHKARKDVDALMERIPAIGGPMRKGVERLTDTVRHLLVPGAFFEELGFAYYGPLDGHNIPLLQRVIKEAVDRRRPVVIHVSTQKGRGHRPAEKDPGKLHAMGPQATAAKPEVIPPTYSQVFSDTVAQIAVEDERIVAITAAMPEGTALDRFQKKFPDRLIDVGIAEQHAVTLAGGLACGGMKPVVALYSTFLQRAYDQIIHDIAIQNLDVTFGVDRAGVVGDDGPTHHGCYDISYLRAVPDLLLMSPKDEAELRHMVKTAIDYKGPAFVRYPRGRGRDIPPADTLRLLPIGKAEMMRPGTDVGIVAFGPHAYSALAVAEQLEAEGISIAVMNARFAKPLDVDAILGLAAHTRRLITIEEGSLPGGFGSAVVELLADSGLTNVAVKRLGIPDRFIDHGTVDLLHADCGLTADNIRHTVLQIMDAVPNQMTRDTR